MIISSICACVGQLLWKLSADQGIIITGLKAECIGNTFYYDIASNSYQASGVKFATLAKDDHVVGATVGDNFYIF